ncbi:urea ABC transporter permease subunit UrtC [Acidisoma cladoniae]|jgi:urea transport system permease protein|uniref:urea ABC transporter permease subunit UrtC n=1 Tax=Acidisoma cladoniae TaxID=3040935 RepID=UPI00254D40F6|nr:urea ABC transporter permease subunit UrtC [Acidisoma sp. PAMC 29798]
MTRISLLLTPVIIVGVAIILAILNLSTPPTSALHVSDFVIGLAGKYLCYAMLALAVDLVWGFAGILTLGHAAFFALGGYCMGMYLTREIGARGVYANADLPDFMIFIGWKQLPWYWHGFSHLPFAILMALIVPGVLAAVFGFAAFRSRVGGVYLSIITQALTYALLLAFFRNDMGFGGNNGMTDFKDIGGFPLDRSSTTTTLMVLSAIFTALSFLFARWLVRSRYGKVLVAVRDAESRTRFLGYRPEYYKLVLWTLSAMIAGIGGALYVPQVGIINPGEFAPANSIEAVIWVAVGGRGTLSGAILGAVLVNFGKTVLTGVMPGAWLYALGGLFILVTLFLPRGIMGTFAKRIVGAALPNAGQPQGLAAIDTEAADLHEAGADVETPA